MKLTVKRKGRKARTKTMKEMARDTGRFLFGGPKKKGSSKKGSKKKRAKKKKASKKK
jgi:hypothetical protein